MMVCLSLGCRNKMHSPNLTVIDRTLQLGDGPSYMCSIGTVLGILNDDLSPAGSMQHDCLLCRWAVPQLSEGHMTTRPSGRYPAVWYLMHFRRVFSTYGGFMGSNSQVEEHLHHKLGILQTTNIHFSKL